MTWNDDLTKTLRVAIAEGKSAGLIAREMGLTRNQVIGKAWRLGIVFDRTTRRLSSKKPTKWDPNRVTSRDWERAIEKTFKREAA